MPAFHYLAIDSSGKEKKGVLQADSERQIRERLRDMQLFPVEVWPVKEKTALKTWYQSLTQPRLRQKIKMADLALMTRQLASLLNAGLPIEQALTGVAEQSEAAEIKSILSGVHAHLLEGKSLAQSMDEFPQAFPMLYRSTIRAGEKSGELDRILNRLADYVEKQSRIQRKVRYALAYPTLLVFVSIAILVFLLIYIVPKIVDVFADSGQSLPVVTIFLLNISHFIREYGIFLLLFLAILIFLFRRALKKEAFSYRFHQFLLKIPVVGRLLKVINSARFSRTFGILFAASVPVLEAMHAAADVVTLLPMKKAVNEAVNEVGEGVDIHLSLKKTGYFSPISLNLIAVGESTGQLEKMLERTADQQDQDVTLFIESALTLFEPLMILVMGGMVLFIVLAVLLPIFNLDALLQ
jgi:general secretion pathway protein F